MARLFDITTTTDALTVAAGKTERLVYTVSCPSAGQRKQRAILRRHVIGGGQAEWVNFAPDREQTGTSTPKDQIEREFPPATQQIDLIVSVPASTPAGQFRVRLDALSVDNPDDDFTEGPVASITVPAPLVTPPQEMPKWIWLVIAGVVVLIVVAVTFLVLRKHRAGETSPPDSPSVSQHSNPPPHDPRGDEPPPRPPRTIEINDPHIDLPQGPMALDVCRDWDNNCGKPAADAYCASQGWAAAEDFRIEVARPPTVIISSHQVCTGARCNPITWVKCSMAPRQTLRLAPRTMEHLQLLQRRGKEIVID